MGDENLEKKKLVEALIERGTTQIILDPRRDGVRVPPEFREQPLLRLNISPRFPGSDLKVDWWGVRQTLTFPSGRFHCHVPWDAIFAVGSPQRADRVTFWVESAPEEFREVVPKSIARKPKTPPPVQSPRGNRKIRAFTPRVIEGARGSDDDDDPPPGSGPPRKRPTLKVIK